jgi:hypothetical protein
MASVRAISCERLKDGFGGLGPDEWLWIIVVGRDEGDDIDLQFLTAAMDAALDLLVGEQQELALDLVEPRSARRRELQAPLQGPPLQYRSYGHVIPLGHTKPPRGPTPVGNVPPL